MTIQLTTALALEPTSLIRAVRPFIVVKDCPPYTKRTASESGYRRESESAGTRAYRRAIARRCPRGDRHADRYAHRDLHAAYHRT